MNLQTLVIIVVASLAIIFAASYLKEFIVKTEGFDGTVPTCTYTAIPIPNAYIPNCSGTASPFICTGYTTLTEAQTACNSVLGCKGITYRLDTAMGLHYTLRSGYVADPTAPVATTMTSFNGESSYVITNLAVCKPNWQEGAAWQTPEIQKTIAAATPAGSVANAAARAAAGPTIAGVTPGGPGMNSSVVTSTTGVTVPGGTMVLTAATNTLWANSMASQPAPLQETASVTAAGPGAGAGGV